MNNHTKFRCIDMISAEELLEKGSISVIEL